MAPTKLLITGVTGYIGGSILFHVLSSIQSRSCDPSLKDIEISVLTRDDPRATYFSSTLNLTVHKISSLDDTTAITSAASQNDIVIGCTLGYHLASAQAILRGLAQRAAQQTPEPRGVYYIHTDGASNFADNPPGESTPTSTSKPRTFSDRDPTIYSYLLARDKAHPYIQRTVALSVIQTGLELNVPTTIITSPTIYGLGTGHFNRLSHQYPIQIRSALRDGYASYIGDGTAQWDYVHIADLAVLYELVLADFASGRRALPTGQSGIMFAGTGRFRWREVAEGIARAGVALGGLRDGEARSISAEEAGGKWGGMAPQDVVVGFASDARFESEVAREVLGWRPERTREDWEGTFVVEVGEVVSEQQGR
ncbi:hypothetical protein LTR70_005311 [Exophiala xenobiotica]|uniref:NAD-dependent epimerase/dehydratase domain-containing protein n=1 Tax=Lithohypha guttulata TaxID=1690604 RepID=A0ABR0K0M3_9EURO|nr:hypothetical protein LTR24_008857 [Lithohypha guttulata]KAK5318747.1 hypothetical protein LTR70_005311 [Exophiala xenobiotica]